MKTELQIGLIGYYGGKLLDILLPTINEDELTERHNNPGHCFHIFDLTNTELYLFSKRADGIRNTAKLDIRSSCKPNSDMSILLVKTHDGTMLLRTYIDSQHSGLYPLPTQLFY